MVLLYGGGGILLFPSLIEEHYAFPNVVVSKGSYVNYYPLTTVGCNESFHLYC